MMFEILEEVRHDGSVYRLLWKRLTPGLPYDSSLQKGQVGSQDLSRSCMLHMLWRTLKCARTHWHG